MNVCKCINIQRKSNNDKFEKLHIYELKHVFNDLVVISLYVRMSCNSLLIEIKMVLLCVYASNISNQRLYHQKPNESKLMWIQDM